MNLQIHRLTIEYFSATEPLLKGMTLTFPVGWTGMVGPNGVGKTTLMKILSGRFDRDNLRYTGTIQGPDNIYYCPQRTDDPPESSEDFLLSLYEGESSAGKLKALLNLDYDWFYRWDSLSYGERKRFQIAVALWKEPDLLLVDEPSNHLDEKGRGFLIEALRRFKGIGLIVSHDRSLLNTLCSYTLFLETSRFLILPGGVDKGLEERKKLSLHQQREYRKAKDQLSSLEKEAENRRSLAADQHKRRSKKGLDKKDHDAKAKINLVRISGKDGVGGKLLRQMDGRINQAREELNSLSLDSQQKTGLTIESRKTQRDFLFRISNQKLNLGESLTLEIPECSLAPGEKLALTGGNGSGKSSLIGLILKNLTIPREQCLYIPQELNVEEQHILISELKGLEDKEKGEIISTVSRLGSDPQRILESREFSPGEARKLKLALGIGRNPMLLILDEPTNHMDILSLTCLEEALKPLDCGLILVCHDPHFRKNLTTDLWTIKEDVIGNRLITR